MRDFTKNTSNFCEIGVGVTGPVLSGAPAVSFAMWIIIDAVDTGSITDNRLFAITNGNVGANDGFSAMIDAFTVPGERRLRLRTRSVSGEAVRQILSGVNLSLGTLYHIAGAADIANDTLYCWIDAAEESTAIAYTNTTYTVGTPNADADRIGTLADPMITTAQFDGALGELALWPEALTQDEVVALARGMSPFMIRRPAFYWPLLGRDNPEIELVRGSNATVNGSLPKRTEEVPMIPLEYLRAQSGAMPQEAAQAIAPLTMNLIRQMAA
jgi:hypothetical protein